MKAPNVFEFNVGDSELFRLAVTKSGFILYTDNKPLINAADIAKTNVVDLCTEVEGVKDGYLKVVNTADVGHTVYEAKSNKLLDAKVKERLNEIDKLMREKDSL